MSRLFLALALVATSACSSGGGDLNNLQENPKPLSTPIASQSDPKTRIGDGQTIRASGVVIVAVDAYDETKDGKGVGDIFVQDPLQPAPKGTPWSGLRLYRPTKNPPDLELAPGMGVDLTGDYLAFTGPPGPETNKFKPLGLAQPQASNASLTLTYEGRAPAPIDLTPEDIRDPFVAMQYASRLVRFKNVTLDSDFSLGRPEARTPIVVERTGKEETTGYLMVSSKFFPMHETTALNPKKGTTYKSITGVLDFFYTFKLCPRSVADIEL
ncbi:MAG: hypothetical protein HYV09_09395 [Deltaproteobacteria bacterium]|nr:hypothetical protein [Deltaproteobacteria bacterium]